MDTETSLLGLGKRLLLVEDEETTRAIVTGICDKLGFAEIVQARDGAEALELLETGGVFGLILSDWHMEPVSGLELLDAVRANERLSATKFMMMTARTDAAAVIAARKAGVDGYILKPFRPAAFAEKVSLVLKATRTRMATG